MTYSKERVFYVYALFDRAGVVRYIGKGKNGRWMQHQGQAKLPFIAETMAVLGDVPKIKVHENLDEFTAYKFEHALIEAIGLFPAGPLYNKTSAGSGPNSLQVRAWHASRTPEERSAIAKKSAAALSPEQRRERGRKSALAAGVEVLSSRMKNWQASRTPEQRRAAAASGGSASIAAQPRDEMLIQLARARALFLASTTAAQRREIAKKTGLARLSKEQLSAFGSKGATTANANRTPKERTALAQRAAAALHASRSPEERSHRARMARLKAALVITHEQRSAGSRKRAQTLGPERLREISLKAVAARLKKKAERSLQPATQAPDQNPELPSQEPAALSPAQGDCR